MQVDSHNSSTSFASQQLLIPIEDAPLGARILTKNPRPWDYDDSLPEPEQATWGKVSLTMHRTDGGIVDAEMIRPLAWIRVNGIEAGKLLPMHIEELQVLGSVVVAAIEPCPEIADGEGSVVTARFLTREVHEIARVEIFGPDGQRETIEGTTIHPIWSEDRQDWVPLGELQPGETLQAATGDAIVFKVQILNQAVPVYNIEVHGEHVYEVGHLGLLVHNECIQPGTQAWKDAVHAIATATKGVKPNFTVRTASEAKQLLFEALGNMNRYKNYAYDSLKYAKGFEVHNIRNAREVAVHTLQHIKWYANRTSGHIFYFLPN